MNTIIEHLRDLFSNAIRATYHIDFDPQVVPAQKVQFGDYQANFAMGLAKYLSQTTCEKTNLFNFHSYILPEFISSSDESFCDVPEYIQGFELQTNAPWFHNPHVYQNHNQDISFPIHPYNGHGKPWPGWTLQKWKLCGHHPLQWQSESSREPYGFSGYRLQLLRWTRGDWLAAGILLHQGRNP